MPLPDTETLLAAAGLVATAVLWAVQRFLPGRKSVGYRVRMDTAIGMNPRDAHSLVQPRLLRQGQEITDATLALLRFENDGGEDIVRQDYQEPLTAEFTGRTVIGVEVPDANPPELVGMLTRNGGGLRHDGGRLVIPRVPLNERDHFKLLVLLSAEDGNGDRNGGGAHRSRGGGAGGGRPGELVVGGFLSGGRIRRNAQRWGPRELGLGLGGVCIILVGLLGGLLLNGPTGAASAESATGRLTVDGSSAFAPPMQDIARQYTARCRGAEIEVAESGSLSGLGRLNRARRSAPAVGPTFLAVSDVAAPAIYREPAGRRAGVILLGMVVNGRTGVGNLTSEQVRGIYDGRCTHWKQLGGSDLPVRIVGRDAASGTRRAFETAVLRGSEPDTVSSYECNGKDRDAAARVTRCEAHSTGSLPDTVGRVPGAIGYAEEYAAAKNPQVTRVRPNGREPDIEWAGQHGYPFWTVEYLYTYGPPEAGSLAAKFRAFMDSGTAKNILRKYRHVPCADLVSAPGSACGP